MEWLDRMNQAMDELERNLTQKTDIEALARAAACSSYHFQRMFSYIAGIPLSEYIRRRRMSLAALELQKGEKVLDTALRWGYDSPTAFNRAFQSIHGITPSAAQKPGARCKAYPRISFQITIKGEAEMNYRIEKKPAFRIVGVKKTFEADVEKMMRAVPVFWQQNGPANVPVLCGLMEENPAVPGILGVTTCQTDTKEWAYYIAAATEKEAPQGMEAYTVPAFTWAVFEGGGEMPAAMQTLQKRIVAEWLPTSGYEYEDGPDIEAYLNDGPQNARFEIWVPVRKK